MERTVQIFTTHERLDLRKVDQLEADADDDLKLSDVLKQVDRLKLLMVDKDKVVFLDLIPHQKEYEGEESADWHRN